MKTDADDCFSDCSEVIMKPGNRDFFGIGLEEDWNFTKSGIEGEEN